MTNFQEYRINFDIEWIFSYFRVYELSILYETEVIGLDGYDVDFVYGDFGDLISKGNSGKCVSKDVWKFI